MAGCVGDGHLVALPQRRQEPLVRGGELEEREEGAVLVEPGHRGADAELDATDRVGLVADRLLLAPAQVVLRLAQDLDEQLLLGGEVPVEHAFPDAQPGDHIGDRRRVVPAGGEALRREAHELGASCLAPCRQLAVHARTVGKLDQTVKNRRARRSGRPESSDRGFVIVGRSWRTGF